MKPIYEPKGKAKEYGDYALNRYTYDELDVTPTEEMEQARKYGWTGTHRKCWCPDCSKRREALKDGVD